MIERKADVLAQLLRASWMVDAGWSPARIAAHYQADRDWRAAVKRLRRKGVVPTIEAIKEYRRGAARHNGVNHDCGPQDRPPGSLVRPICRSDSIDAGSVGQG
jgi:hypothetical protein